jgi:hypothetical protein
VTFTRGHPPPHALRLLLASHRGRRPGGRHRAALVTGERAVVPRRRRHRCRHHSISTPGEHTGDDAAARLLARRCNELAAELIRDRPDRFGGFACLPLPDVDGALAELAYALDDLQLDGVLLFGNARGVYLGDSQFTLLFDELQRRAAVVLVHPNPSPAPSAHALGLPDTLIDFTAENTRAIAQLHYSSTFARTPTSSTSSPAPEVPCPTWPGGSASSTRCASSPEPRAARPRPRHSAACTGIPRRPGATRAAHAPRRRGNRPRRIRHRLPLNAPRSGRVLPRPHRGRHGTHRQRADGRPRRHGHDADPATGHIASQDPDTRFITRPGHP